MSKAKKTSDKSAEQPKQVYYKVFNTMFMSDIKALEKGGHYEVIKEIFDIIDRAANFDSFPEYSSKDNHTYRINKYIIHDIHPKHNINNNVTLLFTYNKVTEEQRADTLYVYLNVLAAPKDHKTGQAQIAKNIDFKSVSEKELYYKEFDVNVNGEELPASSKIVKSASGKDHLVEIIPEDVYGRVLWNIYVDSNIIGKKSSGFSTLDKAKNHVESKVISDILNNIYGTTNIQPSDLIEYSTYDLEVALYNLFDKLFDKELYLATSTYKDWKIIYKLIDYPYCYNIHFKNERILRFGITEHGYQRQFMTSDYDKFFMTDISDTVKIFLKDNLLIN